MISSFFLKPPCIFQNIFTNLLLLFLTVKVNTYQLFECHGPKCFSLTPLVLGGMGSHTPKWGWGDTGEHFLE